MIQTIRAIDFSRFRPCLLLAVILLASYPPLSAQEAESGSITVTITGLRSANGEILVSLYDKAEGFPRDRSAIIRTAALVPDDSMQVTAIFEALPYGDYAIAVLHDEDLSAGMTFGKLHLPKEGYCFSNNVKVRFKAPKFEKAKFALDREIVTQVLRVRY